MEIDHIFIFTDDHGEVADELVSFGLTEGASTMHQGQGTMNRRFVFANFFLEVLWVCDEKEINSEPVRAAGLQTRAAYAETGYSRFGLCLARGADTDRIFEEAHRYQPAYFPEGMSIEVFPPAKYPDLPWTFRLPFVRDKNRHIAVPHHANGIEKLTRATFTYADAMGQNFAGMFGNEKQIIFQQAFTPSLKLTFDDHRKEKRHVFNRLDLTIEY